MSLDVANRAGGGQALVAAERARPRVALAVVKLFPGGGLQRDCLAIARAVRERGAAVTILTAERAAGGFADDLAVEILPVTGRTNHGVQAAFAAAVAAASPNFDAMVGFNKMPGLDLLYCADPSIAARIHRLSWRALLPRYRTFRRLEAGAFAPGMPTRLLLLARPQAAAYRAAWGTEPDRITVLPPTAARDRRQPRLRHDGTRERLRAALGLGDEIAWLAVAVQPATKGLDRTVAALAGRPGARLLVAGLAAGDKAARSTLKLAKQHGVAERIRWLGHREDVPAVMAAADLLVHPARLDITGTVILEAVINGLPVITSGICGYAEHVALAEAGLVLPEPFAEADLAAALATAADPARRAAWSANGAAYGETPELYTGREAAAEAILAVAAERAALRRGR
ncbi:glycosyltransferase family 4 protein [Rhodoplanes azumiensis]|uniref:Glycosyltransferase family 4 protein n=1 Tax=Rhodoplanes azumiensis TaxID=1897628 RepID=A0ABW5ALD3_9BRAD